jgi:hypothetical protein
MIVLPEKGISVSLSVHNCELYSVVDWVLASALFLGEDVSRSDVVDILMENDVYSNQDFCKLFVSDVWSVIEGFFKSAGVKSLSFSKNSIRASGKWCEDLALTYCLLCSLRVVYPSWSKNSCGSYVEQGALLEELSVLSLTSMHPKASFKVVGWQAGDQSRLKFSEVLEQICDENMFSILDLELWDQGQVKDMGLDVYGYFPSYGTLPSLSFMMFQCASGSNWTTKRSAPDLRSWKSILNTFTDPIRGMLIPFLVPDDKFKQSLILLGGPLIERTMLLSGVYSQEIPAELAEDIKQWAKPRIESLAYYED